MDIVLELCQSDMRQGGKTIHGFSIYLCCNWFGLVWWTHKGVVLSEEPSSNPSMGPSWVPIHPTGS